MVKKLIRLPALCEMLGLSRASIYNRLGNGKYADPDFPRPISLAANGKGAVAWSLDEVEAWMDKRMAASRPATPNNAAKCA